MFAKPTRTQFRFRTLAGAPRANGVQAMRGNAAAATRRGATVHRLTGRPVLACRWVAVAGGRLECRWRIQSDDGASAEEPKGSWHVSRIDRPLDAKRYRCRLLVPAAG